MQEERRPLRCQWEGRALRDETISSTVHDAHSETERTKFGRNLELGLLADDILYRVYRDASGGPLPHLTSVSTAGTLDPYKYTAESAGRAGKICTLFWG